MLSLGALPGSVVRTGKRFDWVEPLHPGDGPHRSSLHRRCDTGKVAREHN